MTKVQNFQSKRDRKAYRKGLVRGYLANKVADVKDGAASRAEFYRTLRMKKMERRRVADRIGKIAPALAELKGVVKRFATRTTIPVDSDYVEQAVRLLDRAGASAEWNARAYREFAKQRIYYIKPEGSAA